MLMAPLEKTQNLDMERFDASSTGFLRVIVSNPPVGLTQHIFEKYLITLSMFEKATWCNCVKSIV